MEIDGKKIGRNYPVYIIAEGGVAHFGSLPKAKELVDIAVTAGADAFKLQAFQTDHLIANSLPDWKRRMKSPNFFLMNENLIPARMTINFNELRCL